MHQSILGTYAENQNFKILLRWNSFEKEMVVVEN